ncbi:DUF612 domain-containing protein [Ciceribacter sp. L1K22]|uniref:DUF612 domain-containing protein n=1 Tax=Ciceribacter sp. L1K22 TaxID=2820275 RepID=UPI001ABE2680|nr:DUF612 domain-containing protein [Ciceribacter sp. L1K22]MBO3761091.1 DUF612 domain-containing protein [Ciceribacter sp. L1K22]
MKFRLAAIVAIAGAILAGCTTTEEAQQVIQSRWIGQPVEVFFTQYGPPYAEYPMASGATIYSWRGGDTTRYIAPTYATPAESEQVIKKTTTKTTTETGKKNKKDKDKKKKKDKKVTETTTTTTVVVPQQPQMISPPRYEDLFCELQITADTSSRIIAIRATNDTDGEGLSFSRCAEVLNAHPQK